MTATEQAVLNILTLTGKENAPVATRAEVTKIVDGYYQAKGHMAKNFPVGVIIEKLGVSFTTYAGPVSEALI